MNEVRLGRKLDVVGISKVHAKTWKIAYSGCYLWVLYNNLKAIQFYEHFGFKKEEVFIESEVGGDITKEQRYYIEFARSVL